MIDSTKEYVICAAIWYKHRFREHIPRGFVAQNIDKGMVIGQWRHPNCIYTHRQSRLGRCIGSDRQVQGFLTSKGRFVDRWQAMELAYLANQVSYDRAFKKEYCGEVIDSDSFQKQTPHERHTDKDYNGYNMRFSEDLY